VLSLSDSIYTLSFPSFKTKAILSSDFQTLTFSSESHWHKMNGIDLDDTEWINRKDGKELHMIQEGNVIKVMDWQKYYLFVCELI
jgi:hypothetical protein